MSSWNQRGRYGLGDAPRKQEDVARWRSTPEPSQFDSVDDDFGPFSAPTATDNLPYDKKMPPLKKLVEKDSMESSRSSGPAVTKPSTPLHVHQSSTSLSSIWNDDESPVGMSSSSTVITNSTSSTEQSNLSQGSGSARASAFSSNSKMIVDDDDSTVVSSNATAVSNNAACACPPPPGFVQPESAHPPPTNWIGARFQMNPQTGLQHPLPQKRSFVAAIARPPGVSPFLASPPSAVANSKAVPKAELHTLYGKPPRRKILSASNYHTWHDGNQAHNLLWTSVFVCPTTGELFSSGSYPGAFVSKQFIFNWYSKKTHAEHAAAARAHDCLMLRDGSSCRLGLDEPYKEHQAMYVLPDGGIPPAERDAIRAQQMDIRIMNGLGPPPMG